jgi:flavin-dependent dehydrogenase
MYDVAVIGAGPAGATLARLAARDHKVLLVDKRKPADADRPGDSAKCCGGLLAPDAQAMLSRTGLGLPKDVLVGPQLFVVRAIDAQRNIERYYQRHYINIDRGRFDRWLVSLVPVAADVQLGWRFTDYRREEGHFRLNFSHNGRTYTEQARILVGADGARSCVRRLALPGRPSPRAYLALQEEVEADCQLPYFSTVFDPEITDYYGWTIPKEGRLLVGAAFYPWHGARAKFERLKQQLRARGIDVGKTIRTEAAMILRPVRTAQIATGTDRVVLLGEAAGWISPSSAEGLSYAMKSATILAGALSSDADHLHRLYDRRTRGMRRNILLKNAKSQIIYRPRLRHLVMKTGLKSIHIDQSLGTE